MDEIKLRKEFIGAGIDLPLFFYRELPSTNDIAKANNAPCAVIAEKQTAGRGRNGKSFVSAAGGLYLSVSIGKRRAEENALASIIAGISVAGCVGQSALKWPNDIYLNGRKLGGILCETRGEYLVAGIGLNVNTKSFPDGLTDTATSLYLENKTEYRLESLAAKLCKSLIDGLNCADYYRSGSFLVRSYAKYDILKGRPVEAVAPGNFDHICGIKGIAGGIDPYGRLIILSGAGETQEKHLICGGEVSVLLS